ncbi:hypothetical protein IMSAGC021_01090 [Muribaculaceae bacterium]|nr:hypothetical protein IMSAGC021_01090 [Muribaculaceae bacterium]
MLSLIRLPVLALLPVCFAFDKIKREQLRAAPVYEFPIGTISKVKKIVLGSWCKGRTRFCS